MDNEIKRQVFHIFCVVSVILSYFIPRKLFLFVLLAALILSTSFCFFHPLKSKYWFLKNIVEWLHNLGRDEEKKLGMYYGAASFSLGALMTFWIFGADIFRVAMLVLSFGDAFSTLIGMHFGSRKLFYNKKKTWEGLIMGLLAAFTACLFLVKPHVAFIAALTGMLIESAPVDVNDNLTIPLAVSLVLLVII